MMVVMRLEGDLSSFECWQYYFLYISAVNGESTGTQWLAHPFRFVSLGG